MHSTKISFIFLKKMLYQVPRDLALGKGFFADDHFWHLAKKKLFFWPHFFWGLATLITFEFHVWDIFEFSIIFSYFFHSVEFFRIFKIRTTGVWNNGIWSIKK